jgi:hypothetical protein
MTLVILIGSSKTGKSIAAGFLARRANFVHYKLYDIIVDITSMLFSISYDDICNHPNKVLPGWNLTPTAAIESTKSLLASQVFKSVDNYVTQFFRNWYGKNSNKNIVISDLECPIVACALMDYKPTFIRINNDSKELHEGFTAIQENFTIADTGLVANLVNELEMISNLSKW